MRGLAPQRTGWQCSPRGRKALHTSVGLGPQSSNLTDLDTARVAKPGRSPPASICRQCIESLCQCFKLRDTRHAAREQRVGGMGSGVRADRAERGTEFPHCPVISGAFHEHRTAASQESSVEVFRARRPLDVVLLETTSRA